MPYQIDTSTQVKTGEFFQHYKGGVYEIVTLAANESDGKTMVVYKNWDDETFVRPLEEFVAVMPGLLMPPDTPVHRFNLICDKAALRDLQAHEAVKRLRGV
jgi:hypothetical protein